MDVMLAQPRGFCAGVDRAIEIVERALESFGGPVYVRHEIVHNEHVVSELRAKGAVFVESVELVPDGAVLIFSAHGVSRAVRVSAETRGLRVFDATCPLVTKVHVEVTKMRQDGRELVMIGHAGHPEVEGTMGQIDDGIHLVETVDDVERLHVTDPSRLAYVTQTTLSVDDCQSIIDALRRRFPQIAEPKKQDICYATQNRQDAVKFMAPQCDLVLAAQLESGWVSGRKRIGVTAGASAPEVLVSEVVARLRELGATRVSTLPGVEEKVTFPLPRGLSAKSAAAPPASDGAQPA